MYSLLRSVISPRCPIHSFMVFFSLLLPFSVAVSELRQQEQTNPRKQGSQVGWRAISSRQLLQVTEAQEQEQT